MIHSYQKFSETNNDKSDLRNQKLNLENVIETKPFPRVWTLEDQGRTWIDRSIEGDRESDEQYQRESAVWI